MSDAGRKTVATQMRFCESMAHSSQQPQVGGRQRVRLQLVATERTLLIYVARNCALAIVD